MSQEGDAGEADANEIEAITTVEPDDGPQESVQISDYAVELLRRKGLA